MNSKIILGTVQFGLDYGISNEKGITPFDEVKSILKTANNNNINFIDTASAYGKAEDIIGNLDVREFSIISKFIASNVEELDKSLDDSFNKMNINQLYGYIAHRPELVLKNTNLWCKLEDHKKEGKIQKIGFSFNSINEMEDVLESNMKPDLIQVPYNIFDSRFEELSIIFKKKYGTEIHSRSTFLQGLFFMNPEQLKGPLKHFTPQINYLIKKASELKTSILSLALNYVLCNNNIDKVLVGIENVVQLNEIINSIEKNFSRDIFDDFNSINENFSYLLSPSNWKL